MRFLITVLTNRSERNYAFDIYLSWPYIAFEVLDDTECELHGEDKPCCMCFYERGVKDGEKGIALEE